MTTLGARVWPWVPVVLLTSMLGGLGTMAVIATDDPGFALERNYYEKAVNYDREIAQRGENARLGWKIETEIGRAAASGAPVVVRIRDGSGPVSGARLSLEALRNASASRVLDGALEERAPGEYAGRVAIARGGVWELRLTAERGAEKFTAVERRSVAESAP
ncbi:MAG TPA: FixH family protein [Polyangiaceae bacterium]|nr:FixH family protein [Polyangiaceae bacterium]